MTESRPAPDGPPRTPPPAPGDDALRIVLFGMPDAGKTSLLGGLAQAAQTQEHLLNGHLADPTHGLAELQHRVYDEGPRETLEEVLHDLIRLAWATGNPRFGERLLAGLRARLAAVAAAVADVERPRVAQRRSVRRRDGVRP